MHFILAAIFAAGTVATPAPAATATPKPAVTAKAAAATPTPAAAPTPVATAAPEGATTSRAAPADPDSGNVGAVGATLGFSAAGGKLGTQTGFALSFRRSVLPSLAIGVELGYAQATASGRLSDPGLPGGQSYRVAVTTIPIGVSALYHRNVGPVWIVAGGGPVFAPVTAKASAGGGTNTESGTAFGGELLAGVEFPLGPGALGADLGYRLLSASGVRSTGTGNLGGPGLRAGYRIRF